MKFCTAEAHTEFWPVWTLSGPLESPTVRASILMTTNTTRCHLFITNGNIEFCNDCTHHLSGKTVPLPDFPYSDFDTHNK